MRAKFEMEQAYLNYRLSDALNVKGGLFLIPLGILNLTHEPPTYYGVERNDVETRIIPTTWRELGFGMHGLLGQRGLRYDVGLTTGLQLRQARRAHDRHPQRSPGRTACRREGSFRLRAP